MSNERERISTKEAADILGITPALLRLWMRKGKLKIGKAVRVGQKGSTREYEYLIYRDLVERERTGGEQVG